MAGITSVGSVFLVLSLKLMTSAEDNLPKDAYDTTTLFFDHRCIAAGHFSLILFILVLFL